MGFSEDIVLKKKRFQDRGNRCTNLMNPVYELNGIVVEDDSRYSKPKPLKKYVPGNHLLQTHDIEGAFSGWGRHERREYRNIMSTMDVQGAQADTVKHCIASDRLTNPLTPIYQSLDGEPLAPLLMPLLPHRIVTVPALRPNTTKSASLGAGDSQPFNLGASTSNLQHSVSQSYSSKFEETSTFVVPGKTHFYIIPIQHL